MRNGRNKEEQRKRFEQIKDLLTRYGEGLKPIEYKKIIRAAGLSVPDRKVIRRAYEQVFKKPMPTFRIAKKTRRSKKKEQAPQQTQPQLVKATSSLPLLSDKDKYDLIQVKEVAALVGSFDRVIDLATWLKNWQL